LDALWLLCLTGRVQSEPGPVDLRGNGPLLGARQDNDAILTESEHDGCVIDIGAKVKSGCVPCIFCDSACGSATERADMSSDSARGLIMVVEDESAIADVIRLNLAKAGYGVHIERDGTSGLAAIRTLRPAAVILDIGLPGLDGIEVCRRLRSENDWTPVLFVTARDDEIDRIVGLELGADHYVTKPFSPRELVARVTSVLRRSQGSPDNPPSLVVGNVRLDPAERRIFVGDNEVELTATEFDLLGYLMRRPGRVFSREQLISDVWGYSATGSIRTVDVHIAQVRAKLGDASPIRTVRGVGYAVDNPAQSRGHAWDGQP
jgi:DNA-binding response OmpR family regulator